jgi:ABC-type nitrate/sulfonate/bicarbonate transport system ATPase subunit
LLELLGLHHCRKQFPDELSGGMKMRTSLARALFQKPKLLLMDEAFASLDSMTKMGIENELRRIQSVDQFCVVMVTHSLSEACFLADRILLLSAQGTPVWDYDVCVPGHRLDFRQSLEFKDLWTLIQNQVQAHHLDHHSHQRLPHHIHHLKGEQT